MANLDQPLRRRAHNAFRIVCLFVLCALAGCVHLHTDGELLVKQAPAISEVEVAIDDGTLVSTDKYRITSGSMQKNQRTYTALLRSHLPAALSRNGLPATLVEDSASPPQKTRLYMTISRGSAFRNYDNLEWKVSLISFRDKTTIWAGTLGFEYESMFRSPDESQIDDLAIKLIKQLRSDGVRIVRGRTPS